LNIVNRLIEIKEEEESNDLPIWHWLHTVITKLGEDGMSSDESDTDERTGLPIYRVKNMTWRRKMAYELSMIDKQRLLDKDIYASKGAKPTARIRDDRNGDSRRATPAGKPKKMYCAAWLGEQTPQKRRKLMISDEDFQWLSVLKK